MNISLLRKRALEAGVAVPAILLSTVFATPAFAQDQAATTPDSSVGAATGTSDENGDKVIVVTGTMFRHTTVDTISPISVLNSQALDQRGVNTVTQALQTLSTNNAGTIPNAWNAGGNNFASGGSGISLRGLDSSYTVVLFDGMRTAYYPYADDGQRNFVDINTIPDAVIDRIEVLRDGASSTHGADAVAGVVNIITKKQITGLHLNTSYGLSQRQDAGERRFDATYGYGDLGTQGFNIYANVEYQHNDPLLARDRGYPFNTADQSKICGTANGKGSASYPAGSPICRTNGIVNGIQFNGGFAGTGTTFVPVVRPYLAPAAGADPLLGATTPVAGSRYQLLNPGLGCQGLTQVNLTAAQMTNTFPNAGATASPIQCQEDLTNLYGAIESNQDRVGGTIRATINLGSDTEAFFMLNFYQNTSSSFGAPYGTTSGGFQTSAGDPVTVTLQTVTLPVYVCSIGTNAACTAANGTLNPQNPFAAQGNVARVLYRFPQAQSVKSQARTYRAATGVHGSFASDWHYNVDLTASHIDTVLTYNGVVNARRFLDLVGSGQYNFVTPFANTQETINYLMPEDRTPSRSDEVELQASVNHELLQLPGGPLQLGLGAEGRYESIFWRSSNPANPIDPANRYVGYVNAVGAHGHRWVTSAYGELNAPIVRQLEVDLAGRYDHYSSGQSAFSPKVGVKFTPIQMITLRGSYSKGFRIPSFNEAFGLPTTGYDTQQVDAATAGAAAYFAAHGNNNYATGPYNVGLTATGNPNLKPEHSTNITAGIVLQPTRWLTITADYYRIKIKDLITGADTSGVYDAYYGNNGVVNIPGITVIPGPADPDHPNALRNIGFIQYSFQNANFSKTDGLDFSAEAHIPLPGGIRLTSAIDANRILHLQQSIGGTTYEYLGSLSPCNITSCSGAPKWRGSWQNTLDWGKASISATVYYTAGYEEVAVDQGGTFGSCTKVRATDYYRDSATPVLCDQRHFIDTDMTASYKVTPEASVYINVLNVFDVKAPYDPGAAYGIYNYNPSFHEAGIIGRYFRVGAKVNF